MNADITNFIDQNTIVISDPEGWSIDIDPSKKIIICGDMLDSTFAAPNPPEFFLDKCFNIRNIKNVVENSDRFRLLFGNRDLNKFKCGFLCKIISDTENAKKFNQGEIGLDFSSYEMLQSVVGNAKWNGQMKNWYTFWALGLGTGKKWEVPSMYDSTNFFFNRFNEIFGVDNVDGTMSAQNLLYTIPIELKLVEKEFLVQIIKSLDKTKSKYQNEEDIKTIGKISTEKYTSEAKKAFEKNLLHDYLAFVVLAIFKSMCVKTDGTKSTTKSMDNSSEYKGLLYKLYTAPNTYCVAYSFHEKCLMIYSHGGLSHSLVSEGSEMLDKIYDFFSPIVGVGSSISDNILIKKIKDYAYQYNVPASGGYKNGLRGGYYDGNVARSCNDKNICLQIDSINNYIKYKLFISCANMNSPTTDTSGPEQNELFLLAMSAPFVPKTFVDNIEKMEKIEFGFGFKVLVEGNKKSDLNLDIIGNSPILPGIVGMRNYAFTSDKYTIIQVIGHVPKGFSVSVDLYSNGKDECYVVNIDVSQTLLNNTVNDGSIVQIVFCGDKPQIRTRVKLDVPTELIMDNVINDKYDGLDLKNIKDLFFISRKLTDDEKASKSVKLSYSTNIDILDDRGIFRELLINTHIDNKKIPNEIYYHGQFKTNEATIHLVTINDAKPRVFTKCLVELTDSAFTKFFGLENPYIAPIGTMTGGKAKHDKLKLYKKKCELLESILGNK